MSLSATYQGASLAFEATDSHTLALSNGVVHQTLMLTDHLALGIFNRTGILFKYWKGNRKAPLTNEANARAVLFRCCLKVVLGRQFTNFRFFEFPNGKQLSSIAS